MGGVRDGWCSSVRTSGRLVCDHHLRRVNLSQLQVVGSLVLPCCRSVQQKKTDILKRLNEKPSSRGKWGGDDAAAAPPAAEEEVQMRRPWGEGVISPLADPESARPQWSEEQLRLSDLPLEQTGSNMEGTLSAFSVFACRACLFMGTLVECLIARLARIVSQWQLQRYSLHLRFSCMQLCMSDHNFVCTACFEYPLCGYSAVWLLHGWCHEKLCKFCVHHITMHQFTVSLVFKVTYAGCMCV